jgi:hypothetical protein
MTREMFDQNAEEICTAVRFLLANPKRRKKFQLATVYEKRTNELLAEVLSTVFGPVVVYVTAIGAHSRNTVMVGSRQHRRGRPIGPFTGEPHQIFDVMSRSNASYALLGADLIRAIAEDTASDETGALIFKRVARSA